MTTSEFYLNDVWGRCQDAVLNTSSLTEEELGLCFAGSSLKDLSNETAFVIVPNFVAQVILNKNKDLVEACLQGVLRSEHPISLKVVTKSDEQTELLKQSTFVNDFISNQINPQYTFETFVTGKSNVQAHLAAMTVASNVGVIYNPLFIYGNSGLGKTHLLNAIGNMVVSKFPEKKIGLISGQEFVDGVYRSIQEKRIDEFKQSFNYLDLLLVDDIQFIAGKEKTHEIFFTVFNNLVNNKKQVCITADRKPNEIAGLEDRIISRFNQGLNVNIDTPEFETSVNIVKRKISNNPAFKQQIDDEVVDYIATNFSQDVRSLEGAITRLLFYTVSFPSDDDNGRITLNTCIEAFKDQIIDNQNVLSITKIRKVVGDYYNLSKQQLISKSRVKNIATARHIAMYLSRKLLDAPFKDIGNEFGKRDHSTVISACETIEKGIKKDPLLLKAITEIEGRLK